MGNLSERSRIVAAFATIYFLWGSTYYAILVGLETLPPFSLAAVRLMTAAILIAAIAWFRERRFDVNWKRAAFLGVLFFPLGQGIVTWSEVWLPSGTVALLISTIPIWIAILGWLGGEIPESPRAVIAGLVIGLIGVILLTDPPAAVTGNKGSTMHVVIAIGAALSWSVGTILSRKIPASRSLLASASSEMFIGSLVLFAMARMSGERIVLESVSVRSIAAIGYLVLFGSLIAFLSYTWLLGRVPAYRVASYAYVNPLVAVIFGWLFAGERLTTEVLGASVLIITSVALVVLKTAPRAGATRPTGLGCDPPDLAEASAAID